MLLHSFQYGKDTLLLEKEVRDETEKRMRKNDKDWFLRSIVCFFRTAKESLLRHLRFQSL